LYRPICDGVSVLALGFAVMLALFGWGRMTEGIGIAGYLCRQGRGQCSHDPFRSGDP